jgi:hypothetical protein
MTAEKKKAQQDKSLLSKNTMHHAEGIEAVAKHKKTNREYMKRCREAEGIEGVAKRKVTNRENMKRCCEADSIDVVASRKKINRENMKRHCIMTQLQHKKATTIHQKEKTARLAA